MKRVMNEERGGVPDGGCPLGGAPTAAAEETAGADALSSGRWGAPDSRRRNDSMARNAPDDPPQRRRAP